MTALTPANQLTLLRMLLIPVFALLVVYGYMPHALSVFTIAGLTDALDGLLARRTGGQTTLGAWLDPVADKLLVATMFIVLALPLEHLIARLPVWLPVLVLSRDIGIVLTVAIVNLALGPRTFKPSTLGKASTGLFMITCVIVMYFNYLGRPSAVVDAFIWASLAITLASGIDYVFRVAKIINQ